VDLDAVSDAAKALITRVLQPGPSPLEKVVLAGGKEGFTRRCILRTAWDMGIRGVRDPSVKAWCLIWQLPEDPSAGPADPPEPAPAVKKAEPPNSFSATTPGNC
jgi:hypothetical protein